MQNLPKILPKDQNRPEYVETFKMSKNYGQTFESFENSFDSFKNSFESFENSFDIFAYESIWNENPEEGGLNAWSKLITYSYRAL